MISAYRFSTALFAVWLCLGGCDERSADGAPKAPPSSSASVPANVPSAAATPTPAQTGTAAPRTRVPIELLGFTVTSNVDKKEPVDKLKTATPGARVYAHLKMRNRSNEARTVRVDFLVNGKLRTPLKLEIEPSWSFRTWGYNTLQASDSGELEIQVYDDAGTMLERVRLPIQSK
jgi:Protein of unknown function (DUF2914)